MSDVVILIPALGRPHTIGPVVRSIRETCDANILFLTTVGDRAVMDAIDGCDPETERIDSRPREIGDYAHKINTGLKATTEPFVFTGATDLRFHPGWLEAAMSVMNHPSNVGVVGTNDLNLRRGERSHHATHFLVRRSYAEQLGTIDEPGLIFHEGYVHEMVDDELIGTAKYRGAYHYCSESVVEHLHPVWGKAPSDPMYAASVKRMRRGRPLLNRRKHMWNG